MFAEYWMGDHTNGPSMIDVNDSFSKIDEDFTQKFNGQTVPITALLEHNPQRYLGQSYLDKFVPQDASLGKSLTFLFKVLSVRTALSIQAHPNKSLAEKLHIERPDVYKDPNHKPEIAIALSNDFKACYGFASKQ